MYQDRFPSNHADHPGLRASDAGGLALIPSGIVGGTHMSGAENRMAAGQHFTYRLILWAETLCYAVARLPIRRASWNEDAGGTVKALRSRNHTN